LALPALVLHLAGVHASTGPDGRVGEEPSAVSFSEEEYPTWNLPDGAAVRLGRGRISGSDRAVAFSPDGGSLAVATIIGVWLYDLEDRGRLTLLPVERAQAVAYTTDGTTLVLGSPQGIELWDVATGTRTAALGGNAWIEAMALSPDGGTLATGTGGSRIDLWNLATGSLLATTLDGQTSEVSSVSFSPRGTVLVAGERDGSVRLWDLATGANTVTFRHGEEIRSVSFSPDGATVASASLDGTVKLWDVASGALDLALEARGRQVYSVSYSPDPAILASGTSHGTVPSILPNPRTLTVIGGEEQEGPLNSPLDRPFVVEVRDQHGDLLEGARVTFEVTAGGGTLSAAVDTTDAEGRAAATLTLGREPGTNTVVAAVAGLEPVTFTVNATATPDFDLDGQVGFADFYLFAEAFGGGDARFDLDGSGTVDFADFFLFTEHFGQPARARQGRSPPPASGRPP